MHFRDRIDILGIGYSLKEVIVIGRPRKPEGTRRKDNERIVFLHIPNDIFEKLEARGKPSRVVMDMIIDTLEKDRDKIEE